MKSQSVGLRRFNILNQTYSKMPIDHLKIYQFTEMAVVQYSTNQQLWRVVPFPLFDEEDAG